MRKNKLNKYFAGAGSCLNKTVQYYGTIKNNIFECESFSIETRTDKFWDDLMNIASEKQEFVELYLL